MTLPYRSALIVGAGAGISASIARALAVNGVTVGLASRSAGNLDSLAREIGAVLLHADAADPASVAKLFSDATARLGEPDIVIYNAAQRVRGSLVGLDAAAVQKAIAVTAFGGFLVTQQAARQMVPRGRGAILLTGATASIKGFAQSTAFAMGKFALRGLAQCAARELGPQGIHVAHFIIDGAVRSAQRLEPPDRPDSTLDPDAIAQAYLNVLNQQRSAWSHEVELRPWVEPF